MSIPQELPAINPPLIVTPKNGDHRRSLILLHGRGSNAAEFYPEILDCEVAGTGLSFAECFPSTKFIFPTAAECGLARHPGLQWSQWFDYWSLETPEYREELQNEGLRHHVAAIHKIIQEEAELVGTSQVCIVGLSQGCACGLVSMLLWEDEPVAAFAGMCGWLPYNKAMTDSLKAEEDSSSKNSVHIHSEGNSHADVTSEKRERPEATPLEQAAKTLRRLLDFPSSERRRSNLKMPPIFLGHGMEDDIVPIALGRKAVNFLRLVGSKPLWKEYAGLDHWFSSEMLKDVCDLLMSNTTW